MTTIIEINSPVAIKMHSEKVCKAVQEAIATENLSGKAILARQAAGANAWNKTTSSILDGCREIAIERFSNLAESYFCDDVHEERLP